MFPWRTPSPGGIYHGVVHAAAVLRCDAQSRRSCSGTRCRRSHPSRPSRRSSMGSTRSVPVVSTGVVYLLAVLLVSILLGPLARARSPRCSARPPSTSSTSRRPGDFTIADGENWVALASSSSPRSSPARSPTRPRARAEEAERRRREADLTAEMARVLLGGGEPRGVAARRSASGSRRHSTCPRSRSSSAWVDSDERRRAPPAPGGGQRASGTLLVPAGTPKRRPRRARRSASSPRSRRWSAPRRSATSSRRR